MRVTIRIMALSAAVALMIPAAQAALIGHWTFDEGSGATAYDSSDMGYNGTISSGATHTTDAQVGSHALHFDGTAHVEVPWSTPLTLSYTGYSIAFWVKPDYSGSQDDAQVYICNDDMSNYCGGYALYNPGYGDNAIASFNVIYDTEPYYRGESLPFTRPVGDEWTHIAKTFDGTTHTVYINGVVDASMAGYPIGYDEWAFGLADPLWFGALFWPAGDPYTYSLSMYHFKGAMDDIQIYNQSLTPAQIADVMVGNTASPTRIGDANYDGKVDADDAQILAEHWLEPEGWWPTAWYMGDFNGDKIVDDLDATLMAANWGDGTGSASVPEPSAVVFLVMGALSVLVHAYWKRH